MRKIFYLFFIAVFCIPASAQISSKVKIRAANSGKIAVLRGKLRVVVDLSKDIGGCPFLSGAALKEYGKKGCAAPPADFELVDATEKNRQTFLILTADAQENCNVCGRCGASEATTVIWLKLDANLRVSERKSVPLLFCQENISMISPVGDFNEKTQKETFKLPFKDNVMTFEFEKRIYGEGNTETFEYTKVVYDRTKPEQGFDIKTEKRDKSSVKEQ